MVHIRDEGSQFDAPIHVIWQYLSGPEHGDAHKNNRHQQVKPVGENSVEVSMEQNMGGQWAKVKNRITVFPPVGVTIEVLEGPLAGSKIFNVYTPKGAKTGIDVYGEFVSAQIPAAQLEPAVRGFLASVYEEDNATLKAMAAKK
jgi:hypothetical protein